MLWPSYLHLNHKFQYYISTFIPLHPLWGSKSVSEPPLKSIHNFLCPPGHGTSLHAQNIKLGKLYSLIYILISFFQHISLLKMNTGWFMRQQTTLWIMHVKQEILYKEAEWPPMSKTISLGLRKSISSFTWCWNIRDHHIPSSSVLKISAFFPQYIYAMHDS